MGRLEMESEEALYCWFGGIIGGLGQVWLRMS